MVPASGGALQAHRPGRDTTAPGYPSAFDSGVAKRERAIRIGIYVYDDAEVLDFAGPFEVFSTAARLQQESHLEVFLIGERGQAVVARNGFRVLPAFGFDDHPGIDVLIVSGGIHDGELPKTPVIDWIRAQAASAQLTASVCTGAFLLAEAGLLTGRNVTTHWEDVPALRADYPSLNVAEGVRWVADGDIVTSAGIAAGIDMSLFLVSSLFDPALAEKTARQMDYPWKPVDGR